MALQKLKAAIDKEPGMVKAWYVKRQYEDTSADNTTFPYTMASQDIDEMDQNIKPKKPPRPNNPEKASAFVTELDKAVDTFAVKIHSYD